MINVTNNLNVLKEFSWPYFYIPPSTMPLNYVSRLQILILYAAQALQNVFQVTFEGKAIILQ